MSTRGTPIAYTRPQAIRVTQEASRRNDEQEQKGLMKKAIDIAGRVALGVIGITGITFTLLMAYLFAPGWDDDGLDKSRHWE